MSPASRRQQATNNINMLLLLLLIPYQDSSERNVDTLSEEERRLRDRRLPRPSLQMPYQSAWERVYSSGNEQGMITFCGLDHASFNQLHDEFQPIYDRFTPYGRDGTIAYVDRSRGRPRLLSSTQALGLALVHTRTMGGEFTLQALFGVTGSALNLWLKFSRKILISFLSDHSKARVNLPTPEEVAVYQGTIKVRYPLLKDVWCFADGLKLPLQQAGNAAVQDMFYNGWTHGHYVTNLFVYCPDGTVCACVLNAPGSMHDSELANIGGVYTKLQSVYDLTGGKCVMDSAFCARGNDFVIKSVRNPLDAETAEEMLMFQQATSVRQAAEWGMRAFQGSFPRLKSTMHYEEYGLRRDILNFVVLLYNYRANTVGLNQIRTTFMPHLEGTTGESIVNGGVVVPGDHLFWA
jgi:hypothetical protein